MKALCQKLKQRGKTFSHISEKQDDTVDTISVFLVLSAAKDLLLALREEVLWEDLVLKSLKESRDNTLRLSVVVEARYGSEFGQG